MRRLRTKWQKNRLDGYAGDNYQNSGRVSDTRGGIDINDAPVNVRYNAYSNFLYENLRNCQSQYSNFDYWSPYHNRYWQMNWARGRMSEDNRKNDIYAQKNTINYTKIFNKFKKKIKQGETYQIKICTKYKNKSVIDSLDFFCRLSKSNFK